MSWVNTINSVMKKLVIGLLISLVLIVVLFFIQLNHHLASPLTINKDTLFTVEKGTSVGAFSRKLVRNNWLANRFWLRAYARLSPEQVNIKAGTYLIPARISLEALLLLVSEGKEHQFKVTFVEGTSFKQWRTQLQNTPQLTHNLAALTNDAIAKRLAINNINPEGWFYPETYAFTYGTSEFEILQRAHRKMKLALDELWQQRATNLPYTTPYQALIMASIIEKETSFIPEQPIIASVFINRLAKRMRLQTDPTVIYGLGDRYHGDITRAHLREKTAYNTYRINGLPPTPIAMPGLSAIAAALNPAKSNYFYFVSNGKGEHVFSTTLAEHNRAVRAYLAEQRANKQ